MPSSSAIGATTAMRVAADLRLRILNGEFSSGQRLKIDDISSLLGVSHMPVRAALQELEAEGVLQVFPHRGAEIRGVDARFVRNMYDLRAAIEGMLTERCAAVIDATAAAALKKTASIFETAARQHDSAAMIAANLQLHASINQIADNPEAVRVLGQGRLLVQALRMRFGFGPGQADVIAQEHLELVDAIAHHDIASAGALARRHCLRARDDLLQLIER
jgi:DNA-binding GntR family transcriptional regulator